MDIDPYPLTALPSTEYFPRVSEYFDRFDINIVVRVVAVLDS
jgi:hypothetical protein